MSVNTVTQTPHKTYLSERFVTTVARTVTQVATAAPPSSILGTRYKSSTTQHTTVFTMYQVHSGSEYEGLIVKYQSLVKEVITLEPDFYNTPVRGHPLTPDLDLKRLTVLLDKPLNDKMRKDL